MLLSSVAAEVTVALWLLRDFHGRVLSLGLCFARMHWVVTLSDSNGSPASPVSAQCRALQRDHLPG